MTNTAEIRTDSLNGYTAVRNGGAGIIDLSARGRLRVGGSEAVQFLNGLITNDMKTLNEHCWMPAVFPNVQGRLIAAVRVIRLANESEKNPIFLLDTEEATHKAVLKAIERFTMAGDFRVADITADTEMFSIQGATAAKLLSEVFTDFVVDLSCDGVLEIKLDEVPVWIVRASHTAEDGFDVITTPALAKDLTQQLLTRGAELVAAETFETLRIEAGVARFGSDMDESNVVSETNLDDAVSFTKGCYIGQEIIARIKYRGHVAKKLTGFVLSGADMPVAGTSIKSVEGKEIGRITSATFSPSLEKPIALGYVRYEFLNAGTEVMVGDDGIRANVSELPFIRGT